MEVSPVGDNFTTTIESSPEITGDSFTFTTLSVDTEYDYRVVSVNDCGDGGITNGTTPMRTNEVALCGCGHDYMSFVVTTSNVTCPGSEDGTFTILARRKSGVTVTPDMGRFKYKYQSLTNPADTSAWEAGEPGSPPLPHFFSGVKAGDYEILVWDTLGLAGCEDKDTVSLSATVSSQNQITAVPKAETCDSLGKIVVRMPSTCLSEDRVYWAEIVDSEVVPEVANTDDFSEITLSGLPGGDYQIKLYNLVGLNTVYDTLFITVPNNCSSGGTDTTTVCNLNGITFLPETTLAECDNGQGSVRFVAINDTDEEFTFTVIEESGVVFETKTGTSGITFKNLPSRRYTYEIYDALSQSCRGKFTVGAKSVSFEAVTDDAIACDAIATQINVAIDTATTLAAGPYEVFLVDQADTIAQTSLPLGTYQTSFSDVPVGKMYGVIVRPAAEDACVVRRDVETNAPGTTALQFTYQLDSGTCYVDGGSGSVTISDIVVAENEAFQANVIDVTTQETVQTRQFPFKPDSYTFVGLANGQYQVQLLQQQSSCATVFREKRSETFVVEGAERALTASIRSYVEVTVNYPYGTIEVDSITGGGAPYEVRIAADPSGASTEWVEVINENPIVRPYRYEYLDQSVGTYVMEVRDRFGCVFTRTVEVGYTSELYIPNIFTPNGDGENDTFYILNLENYGENTGVQLKITNRWGNVIYQSGNYTNIEAWTGENYPDGVYFYHLILPDNTSHTGWVEIWRGRTP